MKPSRVVIASPIGLLRDGIASLIRNSDIGNIEVEATVSSAGELLHLCARTLPDIVVVCCDIELDSNRSFADLILSIYAAAENTVIVALHHDASVPHNPISKQARSGRLAAGARFVSTAISGETLVSLLHTIIIAGRSPETEESAYLRSTAVTITQRETEILHQISLGLSNKEIAARLGIQTQTVKNHVSHLLEKLNMEDRVQLAVYNLECDHYVSQDRR